MITILESGFFLSLGITFILIVAIVYSTNSRINILEGNVKSTMNVIHELLKEIVEINHRVGYERISEEGACRAKSSGGDLYDPTEDFSRIDQNFLRDTDTAFLSNTSF
jgi:hypothetical protein